MPTISDSIDDSYESLPNNGILVNMVAGAMAGILEHTATYPFDLIKTRLQCLKKTCGSSNRGIISIFESVLKLEGYKGLYKGFTTMLIGAGPAHALYYSTYELNKSILNQKFSEIVPDFVIHGVAGSSATIAHDLMMTPIDVVKQRLQMSQSTYCGIGDCVKRVYVDEGIGAFFRSLSTRVLMNIPYHVINFTVYEHVKSTLNPANDYNARIHLVAGALSGGLAAFFTNPLDVCMTILNTQDKEVLNHIRAKNTCSFTDSCKKVTRSCENRYFIHGIRNSMCAIVEVGGYKSLFKGAGARVLSQAPSCALSWIVYEFFKFTMNGYY